MKIILSLFLYLFPFILFAERLKIGDVLPSITYKNQFDKEYTINSDLRTIVFVSDMKASKKVHKLLSFQQGNYLKDKRAILLADIHKMPSFISKYVAIPKMKTYKYPIYLIKEKKMGEPFPRKENTLTLISLMYMRVVDIQYLNSHKDLEKFFKRGAANK